MGMYITASATTPPEERKSTVISPKDSKTTHKEINSVPILPVKSDQSIIFHFIRIKFI